MAPTNSKRTQPAFSPPRPGKSKAGKSAGIATKSAKTSATGARVGDKPSSSRVQKKKKTKSNGLTHGNAKGKGNSKNNGGGTKSVAKGAKGTMRAFLDDSASSDDDVDLGSRRRKDVDIDEDENQEDEEDSQNSLSRRPPPDSDEDSNQSAENDSAEDNVPGSSPPVVNNDGPSGLNFSSSPEPDFILAEVTTTKGSAGAGADDGTPAIPLPLIHRIMHAHFARPEETSISGDARALMGKYVEVFVKEAIRRCADEKKERAQRGAADVGDTGWLEVEDLERVGCQLVLDF
jgi:hypothetical protein